MKRIFTLGVALILVLGMTIGLAGCGGSSSSEKEGEKKPEYVLKLAHPYALEDNIHKSSQKLAELVEERTDGAIKIEIYGAGQLVTIVEEIESVVSGTLHIAADAINTMDGFKPLAGIESYPFLFNSAEELVAFLDSDLSRELYDDIGGDTFKILGPQFRGARYLQTTKPVRQLSDLKGLKLRCAPMKILHKPWEILGANVTPMDFTEIYTGLQQGTIEGQENPLLTSYAAGFAEVEKYVMNTKHVYGVVGWIFNKQFFESLPDEYQQIIMESAKEAADWRTQIDLESEEVYLQKFIEAGAEYIELEDLDEWQKALEEPLKEEFPYMQEWVAKIKEFTASL